MSLPHALLTALSEHPGSGSDLARRFDRSIGYFWQATHQHIYRELGRMEDAAWIQSSPVDGGRGRKRRYQITDLGRDELRRWTVSSLEPSAVRDELMVRLRAAAVVGPTGLADELITLAASHRQKLDLYQAIEARDFSTPPLTAELELQHLVLKAGIAYEALRAQWCDEAIQILNDRS